MHSPWFKDIKIHKTPERQDDSAFFTLENFYVDDKFYNKYAKENDYFELKNLMFHEKLTEAHFFKTHFKNKNNKSLPSLKNLENIKFLNSTVYTASMESKNEELELEFIFEMIRETLKNNPNSRRLFVRLSNSFGDYLQSENHNDVDISCLTGIHYLKNSVTLFSRALFFYEEFYVDLLTIYWHLLRPIYGMNKPITINWMVSTSQFLHDKQINNFKNKLAKIFIKQ